MEIVRKDKTVKFSTLRGNTVFIANGIAYLKLSNPIVLKIEPDRFFNAVHLGMGLVASIEKETDCVPLIGRFVEDAK